MANGVNRVHIVGNLGNDPDTRFLDNGTAVTKLSVATTETWKDKSGEKQEETSWHRVVIWGKLAEIAGEYLRKGSQVYIEGKLKYGSYEKDGVTHYTTDIVASEMRMLGGKPEGGERSGGSSGSRGGAPQRQRQAPQQQQQQQRDDDFVEDDIPFATQYSTH